MTLMFGYGVLAGIVIAMSLLQLWGDFASDMREGGRALWVYCRELFAPEPFVLNAEAKRKLIARLEANRRQQLDAVTRDFRAIQGKRS